MSNFFLKYMNSLDSHLAAGSLLMLFSLDGRTQLKCWLVTFSLSGSQQRIMNKLRLIDNINVN